MIAKTLGTDLVMNHDCCHTTPPHNTSKGLKQLILSNLIIANYIARYVLHQLSFQIIIHFSSHNNGEPPMNCIAAIHVWDNSLCIMRTIAIREDHTSEHPKNNKSVSLTLDTCTIIFFISTSK